MAKQNQMNAINHITFNPPLKKLKYRDKLRLRITTKQTFKIETSQRVTKAFTNRICVSNMTFFSAGEFVGDYVNNHAKRFEFILCIFIHVQSLKESKRENDFMLRTIRY